MREQPSQPTDTTKPPFQRQLLITDRPWVSPATCVRLAASDDADAANPLAKRQLLSEDNPATRAAKRVCLARSSDAMAPTAPANAPAMVNALASLRAPDARSTQRPLVTPLAAGCASPVQPSCCPYAPRLPSRTMMALKRCKMTMDAQVRFEDQSPLGAVRQPVASVRVVGGEEFRETCRDTLGYLIDHFESTPEQELVVDHLVDVCQKSPEELAPLWAVPWVRTSLCIEAASLGLCLFFGDDTFALLPIYATDILEMPLRELPEGALEGAIWVNKFLDDRPAVGVRRR